MAQKLTLSRATLAPVLAEFLGTAVLVMMYLVLTQTTAVSYFIGTSVALALGVVYLVFGGISGGHFNPAITVGSWVSKKITQNSTIRTVSYIAAQFVGGFAALKLYEYLINHEVASQTVKYTFPILLAEALGALVLTFGFVTAKNRAASMLEGSLAYGAALFVGTMVASTAAAGLLNPAVALGVHNFNWVYVVGPALGAVVAALAYQYVLTVPAAKVAASKAPAAKAVAKPARARKTAARRRR